MLKYLHANGVAKFTDVNPQFRPDSSADFEKKLLPLIRTACASNYPALFANEATDSIPIAVEVQFSANPHVEKRWPSCYAR